MKDYLFLAILITGWSLINIWFNEKDHKEVLKALNPTTEYDYTLELKSDTAHCEYYIEVRTDQELFIVHPDSLEEFIAKDNL